MSEPDTAAEFAAAGRGVDDLRAFERDYRAALTSQLCSLLVRLHRGARPGEVTGPAAVVEALTEMSGADLATALQWLGPKRRNRLRAALEAAEAP